MSSAVPTRDAAWTLGRFLRQFAACSLNLLKNKDCFLKLVSLKFKTRKLKSILYDWDLPVAVPGVRAAAEL